MLAIILVSKDLKIYYIREVIHFSRKPPHRRKDEKTGAADPGLSVLAHHHS
jgi:hypothetical protein